MKGGGKRRDVERRVERESKGDEVAKRFASISQIRGDSEKEAKSVLTVDDHTSTNNIRTSINRSSLYINSNSSTRNGIRIERNEVKRTTSGTCNKLLNSS